MPSPETAEVEYIPYQRANDDQGSHAQPFVTHKLPDRTIRASLQDEKEKRNNKKVGNSKIAGSRIVSKEGYAVGRKVVCMVNVETHHSPGHEEAEKLNVLELPGRKGAI